MDEEDQEVSFYGPSCTTQFFYWLEEITMNQDGDDRDVIIIFHNLKGYDGMFLLDYCYHHHREVTNQITLTTKILSFMTDRLTFKDSLCFLPMPLANFPTTFGIQELTKGFFPHLFDTLQNQEYRGPMPPASSYDPDGMSTKKKSEFKRWYADKVHNNYTFHLKRDMEAYRISDVKLLKACCQKFRQQFK